MKREKSDAVKRVKSLESSTKVRGLNRDILIGAFSPDTNFNFILKRVEQLKHLYFNVFTDHDRRVFDNLTSTQVAVAVKYTK
jgi:hypothetical protein